MGGIAKELLPLGPRLDGSQTLPLPVIANAINAGIRAGADRCMIVTSAAKAPTLMQAVASLELPLPISYLHQQNSCGLGSAIECVLKHVKPDDIVLMLMPDTVMRPLDVIVECVNSVRAGALASATLFRVAHPRRFGVAEFNGNGDVVGFAEKPQFPKSDSIWTSVAFSGGFFSYIRESNKADLSFTAALDFATRDGKMVFHRAEGGQFWDVGNYDDYLLALSSLGLLRSGGTS